MAAPVASGSQAPNREDEHKQILNPDILKDFLPSRVFPDVASEKDSGMVAGGKKQIISLCFEDTGRTCVTAGEDEMITYWDVLGGKKVKGYPSAKYGVDHLTPTHQKGHLLHSSTKGDEDDVRLFVADRGSYLKYYKGHTKRVGSISMNPAQNTFLTGSHDGTVILWDQRADKAQGMLNQMEGPCLVDWDPTGIVFAVAMPDIHYVCLYSNNQLDKAPFESGTINDPELDKISVPRRNPYITSIKFSNNGKYLLVGTSGVFHYVMDSYDLSVLARLEGHEGLERDKRGNMSIKSGKGLSGAEVCWTPDSCFVMSGSWDGRICMWDLTPPPGEARIPKPVPLMPHMLPAIPTITPISSLNEEKSGGPCRALAFNPKYMVFASAGEAMAFWLPAKKGAGDDDGDQMDIKMEA